MMPPLRTRLAPSPTGLLHVGNGYSALICQRWAQKCGTALLLRIEDIDRTRCQIRFVDAIQRDLHWLGIEWQPTVMLQSSRKGHYKKAIEQLRRLGVLYPCFCSRASIRAQIAVSAPHHAQPHYPGTCRSLSQHQRAQRMKTEPYAWRLHVKLAAALVGPHLHWLDADGLSHPVTTDAMDDVILVRKDIGISYHLAVVVDDAAQAITMVIRGEDLRESTAVQVLLQRLLNLPQPYYLHHALVVDGNGKRLAKRNDSTTLYALARAGVSAHLLRNFLLYKQNDAPIWDDSVILDIQVPSFRKCYAEPHPNNQ